MSVDSIDPAADEREVSAETRAPAVGRSGRKAPATVVNGTRVTIAFPFSHLTVSEPGQEVRALAELVVELADALVKPPGDDAAESLRQRAHALREGLSSTSRP